MKNQDGISWFELIIMARKKFPRVHVITSSKRQEYRSHKEKREMIELPYSLIIEATEEPDYFGFYSPDLEGFTGIGHSVEDCLFKAKWGMKEHVDLLKREGLPIPPDNPDPKVIVQNEKKLAVA
jgi:predicted RNase H-like HicB family nuclease